MKFQLPETLVGLSAEDLSKLRAEATAEIKAINDTEADLTAEQLDSIEQLLNATDSIDARVAEVEAEATAKAERAAALRERIAGLDKTDEAEAEGEPDEEPAAEPEPVEDEPAEPAETPEPAEAAQEQAPEPVLAAGSTVAAAKRHAPAVIIKKEKEPVAETAAPTTTITAAANLEGFDAGQALDGMGDVTAAFLSRVGGFGITNPEDMPVGEYKMSAAANRSAVARIKRDNTAFAVDSKASIEEQMRTIMAAADERQLNGGSVIAAGGWCAPSETMYELFGYETTEGLLDLPEVTARRGGIRFTKGPSLEAVLADPDSGFLQTEAQAEAGTLKACYAIDCPDFEEVRLDAIGFCMTAPLLTNAAWPELVRRHLDLLGIGHARKKNKYSIDKIAASTGTAIVWAGVGAGVADTLGGLEMQAMRIRQSLSMPANATIEGFTSYWAKAALRYDLSNRLGIADPFRVTDAEVESYLAARNIRLQFVYDYNMLSATSTGTWTRFPETVEFNLYPAGAYTRLVNDVIKLDAVYDHELLTGNTYTAAFAEEGVGIANTRGFGVKLRVPLNYRGASGFPSVGAGEGITFASA